MKQLFINNKISYLVPFVKSLNNATPWSRQFWFPLPQAKSMITERRNLKLKWYKMLLLQPISNLNHCVVSVNKTLQLPILICKNMKKTGEESQITIIIRALKQCKHWVLRETPTFLNVLLIRPIEVRWISVQFVLGYISVKITIKNRTVFNSIFCNKCSIMIHFMSN